MRATAVIEDAGTTSKRTMEFPRRCSSLLLLPLLLLLFLTSPGHGGLRGNRSEHYLVLHPFYSGSHVLTLHAVAEELVNRGHRVTTVRYSRCTVRTVHSMYVSRWQASVHPEVNGFFSAGLETSTISL